MGSYRGIGKFQAIFAQTCYMRLCPYPITLVIFFACLGWGCSPGQRVTQIEPGRKEPVLKLSSMENNPKGLPRYVRWHFSLGLTSTDFSKQLQTEIGKKPIFASVASQSQLDSKHGQSSKYDFWWWLLMAIAALGIFGTLLYLVKWLGKLKTTSLANSDTCCQNTEMKIAADVSNPDPTHTPQPQKLLPPETTSRLAKVSIVEELIKDLASPDPIKRSQAIWDLGQQGDSRAIQPLVDLMVEADSQQRSLILAALAEIGTRTLKPMSRALAVSLQDESPQVRQNAIRDLTRIYDAIAQISQMLCHAVQDSDAQVQATARYALAQMHRIRSLSSPENFPETSSSEYQK